MLVDSSAPSASPTVSTYASTRSGTPGCGPSTLEARRLPRPAPRRRFAANARRAQTAIRCGYSTARHPAAGRHREGARARRLAVRPEATRALRPRARATSTPCGSLTWSTPRLVRGFDYYVRTTFELTTTRLGAQNAAGGGRYDGLVEQLGGPRRPRHRLRRRYRAPGPAARQRRCRARAARALLIPLGEAALRRCCPSRVGPRAGGSGVELALRHAEAARGAGACAQAGRRVRRHRGRRRARARGEAVLREMSTGTQRTVACNILAEELLRLGGARMSRVHLSADASIGRIPAASSDRATWAVPLYRRRVHRKARPCTVHRPARRSRSTQRAI